MVLKACYKFIESKIWGYRYNLLTILMFTKMAFCSFLVLNHPDFTVKHYTRM